MYRYWLVLRRLTPAGFRFSTPTQPSPASGRGLCVEALIALPRCRGRDGWGWKTKNLPASAGAIPANTNTFTNSEPVEGCGHSTALPRESVYSEHRLDHPVGRGVAVGEGLDVDDDLLAHIDAAFDGRRAHMRQQHHVIQLHELGVDRRLVLENVEPRPGDGAAEYKGVAAFFRFLSLPMVLAYWHANTGYVPITNGAYELMKKLKFYKDNPGRDIPILQMSAKPPTANSKGLRFGNFVQVRGIIYEELEAIWAGKKTAQQGLDDAVRRGNVELRKFEKLQK